MTRGAPDDSNVLSTSTFYRLDDMAELAVRLGSVVNYHRAGNVVFATDFGEGLSPLDRQETAVGGIIEVSNDLSLSGGVAVMLGYVAAVGSRASIGVRYFPVSSGKVGLGVVAEIGKNLDRLSLDMVLSDAVQKRHFRIRLYPETGIGTYYSADGPYVEFTDDLPLVGAVVGYTTFKMIVDVEGITYETLTIGDKTFDLGSAPGRELGIVPPYYFQGYVTAWGNGLGAGSSLIDSIVLTRNEV